MAFSTHLWHFIISSTINGFLQGSGWPAVIKHIRQMFSTAEFATTYTIMSCTNNVAAIIATSFIIVLVFALYQTENSSTFPIINHKSSLCNEEAKQKRFSWRLLFGSETFWIITFYYSLTMASRAIAEVWIPIFVSEHFSEVVALEATFFFEAGVLFRMWISFYAFLLGFFIYACINIWGILSSDMIDVSFAGRCDALFSFISNCKSYYFADWLNVAWKPSSIVVE
uniref:Uncharacterized protein n=1 Tax=Parascaris equorum TaxID=6256 RepID=A0A914RUY3_PAREQ